VFFAADFFQVNGDCHKLLAVQGAVSI
jgi:hypothetical protein